MGAKTNNKKKGKMINKLIRDQGTEVEGPCSALYTLLALHPLREHCFQLCVGHIMMGKDDDDGDDRMMSLFRLDWLITMFIHHIISLGQARQ